jgi:hypothetical protein
MPPYAWTRTVWFGLGFLAALFVFEVSSIGF